MRFLSIRKPRSGRRRRSGRGWSARFSKPVVAVILFGACAVLAARLDSVGMRELSGAVTVHDGDTLTMGGERIRLSGIDAFELDQTCQRNGVDYSCGKEARALLSRLVVKGGLHCEGKRRDRYQRLLATCRAGDVDLNGEMVSAGWAVSYGGYRLDEISARLEGRGAWEGEFVAPSVWRASKGQPAEARHDFVSRVLASIGQYLFQGSGIAGRTE